MDDNNIELDVVPQGEHVPEAERNNRTIGEHIRATFHPLPYRMIPEVMLKTLAVVSCRKLNYFPAKNGVSEYFSPHMLMNRENINYNKTLQVYVWQIRPGLPRGGQEKQQQTTQN